MIRRLVNLAACASLVIAAAILAVHTPALVASDAHVASFAPIGQSRYPVIDCIVMAMQSTPALNRSDYAAP